MQQLEEFLLQFEGERGRRVFVEDDGRVAYGYLQYEGLPNSLVWLYNRAETPAWFSGWESTLAPPANEDDPHKPPLNIKENIKDLAFVAPKEADIELYWDETGRFAAIYIYEHLHAVLEAGQSTGWCLLANGDGPLAKDLNLSTQLREMFVPDLSQLED